MKTGRSDATPPKREYPTEFQRRMMWMAIAAVSMLAVASVVVYTIGVFTEVLQFLQPVLVPIAAAGILAYLLEPIVKKLTDRGTPRFRAMMLVWLGFHGVLLLLFLSVVVPIISQLSDSKTRKSIVEYVAGSITATIDGVDSVVQKMRGGDAKENAAGETAVTPPPQTHVVQTGESAAIIAAQYSVETTALEAANTGRRIEPGLILALPAGAQSPESGDNKSWVRSKVRTWVAANGERIAATVGGGLTRSLQGLMGLMGYLIGLVLVPLYLYYFLKESAGIQKGWSDYIPLRASKFKAELVDYLTEVNGYLIAFFRGQMLVSMIDGLLVGVSLALLGLPYAMLIGVFVALLGLIPYVGNVICWFAAVGISISHFSMKDTVTGEMVNTLWGIQSLWAYPLIVTGVFVLVQKINSLVTAPRIVGDAVGLHPLTVIFSVLFWSLLIGGLLGALLAVPLTASLKVLFRRYIWEKRVQRQLTGPADYSVS